LQQHVFKIAEVCAQYGVKNVIICPGSRSAPLVYAFTQHPEFECQSVIDERSAGFIALGIAQQQHRPVVLICTSGTATLNFFPAIAEAFYQKIPLLVLSADRPPELLNQQDGQMIMQKGVFNKHVLGSHELLCYDEDNTDYLLTERIVSNALETCLSEKGFGPVHINVPLREPLYNFNDKVKFPPIGPLNLLKRGAIQLPNFEGFMAAWRHSQKRLIVVGQMQLSPAIILALDTLCQMHQVVIISDITSNLHLSKNILHFDMLFKAADKNQLKALEPDILLSFGGPMISKSLKQWLKSIQPIWHFRLQSSDEPIDTWGNMTHLLCANETSYLTSISKQSVEPAEISNFYFNQWKQLDETIESKISHFHQQKVWCEPSSVYHVIANLAPNSIVQIGNSSVVRWVSWNAIKRTDLEVYCNRGTSGIDGSLSTALGAAIAKPDKLVYLLIGDLSFIYDEHALWGNQLPKNLKVIVLNNQGGNIFNWIDGPSKHPDELPFFTTPNRRSIQKICDSYDVLHLSAGNYESLQQALVQTEKNNVLSVIELTYTASDALQDIKRFLNIKLDS
jgi:2-succinyl-5-enolpyruvyl-6-hydroxy-3-cyclohexene-1-carboxylate synthase